MLLKKSNFVLVLEKTGFAVKRLGMQLDMFSYRDIYVCDHVASENVNISYMSPLNGRILYPYPFKCHR